MKRFDYAGTGAHPQPTESGKEIRFAIADSPLKYSFSEAGQEKTITVIELKEKGTVELRTIPLKPLRDHAGKSGARIWKSRQKHFMRTATARITFW
ncbi:MAG: hypothetical protein ACLRIL_05550 [Fusicatenibacter saccharivorans]